MTDRRSKEDEVQKISISIFVTNFPDTFNAKDLWRVCNQYGNVVDTFIPDKRSKSDKRFGFVRFIKIASVERLVNKHGQGEVPMEKVLNGYVGSFAHAVKKGTNLQYEEAESKPALVLDDSCLNQSDMSTTLMGKNKVFNSLSNLKPVLANEGFDDIKLKYMGCLWVLIEFHANTTKDKFMANTSVVSWFSHLQQAMNNVIIDERVIWLDIKGVSIKAWTNNTFKRIASKWGELLYDEDQEELCFHSKRVCVLTRLTETIFESFKIIVQGKVFWVRAKEVCGWTPDFVEEEENESEYDDVVSKEGDHEASGGLHNPKSLVGDSDVEEVSETIFEKIHSQTPNEDGCNVEQKRTQSDDPFNIYDILKKKKDSTKVGSSSDSNLKFPPGFTHLFVVEDKSNDMNVLGDEDENHPNYVQEEIISSSAKEKNTRGSILQVMEDMVKETKMESLELFNIKRCWGNFNFDYVYSPLVGNSGGILCVWDPRVFHKDNSTVSDYFVMVRGEWIPNGMLRIAKVDFGGIRAVWDCGTDKSPGLDGFTFGFYRRFWCVIENDVVEAVNTFFQNATFPKGGNASFIALIPKTHDANMVKDIRPITLIGSLYKIIAKILANRLVSVLGNIGDPLSPFLFLLVMENDAVFMGQWSESNINVIVKVLDCFYQASGLRINMNKSNIMGLSVDNDKVIQATAKIGCASLKTPFWYLGTKVGGLMSHIKSWDEIVSKFGSRLSKWKMKTLSIAGIMTLIKLVL
ncbi:nucleotide-binding alpha-beta plait domain-containing protein, partial [Tanacetum coccineum]